MQNEKKIIDRMSYLSWSKMQIMEKDPNLFYQIYYEGLDQLRTKYLLLGKRMAETLERGYDEERDPQFEMVAIFMPGYPKKEFKIDAVMEGIPLKGVLDGFDEKNLIIGEVKTGKMWSQSMADTHGQLTFYALLVYLKYGKMPSGIYLHWARTQEDAEGNLTLTGDIKTFKTKRTLADVILFTKRIRVAWEAIKEMGKFMTK